MDKEDIKEWFDDKWFKIKRFVKFTYQNFSRGYSDKVTYNLYEEIAEYIHPRLVLFKKLNNGFPPSETAKSWDKKLDKMIMSFDMIIHWNDIENSWIDENKNYKVNKRKMDKDTKILQEGLGLFAQYFMNLWW